MPEKRELLVELFEKAARLKQRVDEMVKPTSAPIQELVERARSMW